METVSMGNIVEFPPRFTAREVWECQCGHRRFVLLADRDIACGQCDELQPFRFFEPPEDSPDSAPEGSKP